MTHHPTSCSYHTLFQTHTHLFFCRSVVPLQRLSPGSDLNVPPENWLRGLHRAMERGSPSHSSIRIASSVADQISWSEAAIDLISNSRIM